MIAPQNLSMYSPGLRVMSFEEIDIPKPVEFPVIAGVVPVDLLAIIRLLSRSGHFSISQYNEVLKRLEFASFESSDKPCPVPLSQSKKFTKLKGKAISHWVHVRNFPLIIRGLVKHGDDPLS